MSSPGRLILVRHGESFGNRERVFADDPAELALTERGYSQARAAAVRIGELYSPRLVVASPFLRASETARIIAEHLDVPLQIEANLYERDIGSFRGKSYDALTSASGYDPERHWLWKPDGGESYGDVQARVAPILSQLRQQYPSQDVVIVSHGGVMLCLWAYVMGSWDAAHAAPNCGIVCIEHGPQGFAPPRVIDPGEGNPGDGFVHVGG